jgi:disulfide bond formation protein DsbB
MSVTTLHDVFAVMAMVALAGVVLMVIVRLVPSVAAVQVSDRLHRLQLPLAALVAGTAALGSLWFSEYGNHWAPCRFCWFQRIFMYSLAVVLLLATIRRDRAIRPYAVTLAGIGLLVAIWHNLLERGVVHESAVCAATVPCANPYYVSFGHINPNTLGPAGFPSITLTVMAFSAFAAILALLLLPEPLEVDDNGEPSAS